MNKLVKIVRKRGHPNSEGEELKHYNITGSHWGKRVDYVRGVGWVGDGISKKLHLRGPFQGRTKQYGGGPEATAASASGNSSLSKYLNSSSARKQAAKPSGSSSSSSTSAGGGGGSGAKYNADLRAKLDALRGSSEKAQKEKEKAEKEAEKEAKKKAKEEEAARKKEEAARKKEAAAAEKERKAREAEENKAYKQRLSIERQARQLFDRWKQEELRKKQKQGNTLKKSQVTMVADRGRMKSWNGPRRSRSNKMR